MCDGKIINKINYVVNQLRKDIQALHDEQNAEMNTLKEFSHDMNESLQLIAAISAKTEIILNKMVDKLEIDVTDTSTSEKKGMFT